MLKMLRLELLILVFVRAHRENNFNLHIEALEILQVFSLPLTTITMLDGYQSIYEIYEVIASHLFR